MKEKLQRGKQLWNELKINEGTEKRQGRKKLGIPEWFPNIKIMSEDIPECFVYILGIFLQVIF